MDALGLSVVVLPPLYLSTFIPAVPKEPQAGYIHQSVRLAVVALVQTNYRALCFQIHFVQATTVFLHSLVVSL